MKWFLFGVFVVVIESISVGVMSTIPGYEMPWWQAFLVVNGIILPVVALAAYLFDKFFNYLES